MDKLTEEQYEKMVEKITENILARIEPGQEAAVVPPHIRPVDEIGDPEQEEPATITLKPLTLLIDPRQLKALLADDDEDTE